jgi:aryl-alcohol dehydrogenase-like predicted oxidoreductase
LSLSSAKPDLLAVYRTEGLMLPIPGASTVEHLAVNTAAALLNLDDAILEELERDS